MDERRLDVRPVRRKTKMLDLIMVALGVGFFVLALGFSAACDRM
ncbi:MAG TPA: hypothetical protein VK433_11435 [Stellaceae bacterium]|nr:hypothetical protein [Stellaceae bacterium]